MAHTYLRHVMDALSDAHQNVIDVPLLVDQREMTADERELLALIDSAFHKAHEMRMQSTRPL